jgi:hypothetical protein
MRAEGYYWVKYKTDEVTDSNDFWNIRYFSDGLWQVPYYDFIKEDSFFEEIDERRIERCPEAVILPNTPYNPKWDQIEGMATEENVKYKK